VLSGRQERGVRSWWWQRYGVHFYLGCCGPVWRLAPAKLPRWRAIPRRLLVRPGLELRYFRQRDI